MAFTDFGIENLIELIKMHKDDPALLKRWHRPAAETFTQPDIRPQLFDHPSARDWRRQQQG
jgi:hypothetical protein